MHYHLLCLSSPKSNYNNIMCNTLDLRTIMSLPQRLGFLFCHFKKTKSMHHFQQMHHLQAFSSFLAHVQRLLSHNSHLIEIIALSRYSLHYPTTSLVMLAYAHFSLKFRPIGYFKCCRLSTLYYPKNNLFLDILSAVTHFYHVLSSQICKSTSPASISLLHFDLRRGLETKFMCFMIIKDILNLRKCRL